VKTQFFQSFPSTPDPELQPMLLLSKNINVVLNGRLQVIGKEWAVCKANSIRDFTDLKGLQVLLVEDCVDQGRLYLSILKSAGVDVTLECNGQAAVDAIRKTPDLFDAVVMDFQMPEVDGVDATRHLRTLGYRGAIIAMTAFGVEGLEQLWTQAGCNTYLTKPLDRDVLLEAVLSQISTDSPVQETVAVYG